MQNLEEFLNQNPILPYIRESDFAFAKPWLLPERRLLDYLLIYIQEGYCRYQVDNRMYELAKGEYCLIQPNSLNVLEGVTDTVTPYVHFDMFYNPEREKSFPTRAGQVDISAYEHLRQPRLDQLLQVEVPVKLFPSKTTKFRDVFLQVVEFWQYRDPLMQLKAQAGMMEIIIMILEQYLGTKASLTNPPQTLNWITSYLSLHLNETLRVTDMAKRANLSLSRFNQLFKRNYGVTPHQYLLEMRVGHACELLQNTKLTQEQVAEYCGFSNIHHFSKMFKQKTGKSPGQYRGNQ